MSSDTSRAPHGSGDLGPNDETWRALGLRAALAHMPRDAPGRAVVERLLTAGRLGPGDGRRFKAHGLRRALASMPPDSPGRAVVEAILAQESHLQADPTAVTEDDLPSPIVSADMSRPDVVEQLERLAALHTSGQLDDAEFETAKRRLLDIQS